MYTHYHHHHHEHHRHHNKVPTTQLAKKMSIDLKFAELTADVLDIFFNKISHRVTNNNRYGAYNERYVRTQDAWFAHTQQQKKR